MLLKLKNIKKSFNNNHVLKGIDLSVENNEIVVLIGASGSGKSTLLRCVNLLEQIDDGEIIFGSEDIADPRIDKNLVRSKIGIVFQSYNLFPHMNVIDNVTIASKKVHKIKAEIAEEKAKVLLQRIGLGDKIFAHPDQLSGGQQQRVAIVRALLTDPPLLLLDEITAALDPQLVGEVLDLVKELKKEQKQAILMATHEMGFARQIADKIVFLQDGKIVEQGPPTQIFDNPQKEATKKFLSRVFEGKASVML